MSLLCSCHLPTPWSWCMSYSSTTLSSIQNLNWTISEWAQYWLWIVLLSCVRCCIFWASTLSSICKIWWRIAISYNHAVIVWKHMTMWYLSLILWTMNHLWRCINWLSLAFGTAMFFTLFCSSRSIMMRSMMMPWSSNSLSWWAWNGMTCQSLCVYRSNMWMGWLFWRRSGSTWTGVWMVTLFLCCAIWSLISTWCTLIFAVSSSGRFALIIWTQSTIFAQTIVIAAHLWSLFLDQLLVVAWRISSSVKLLLISELLLFWWVMLLCLLMRAHLIIWDGSLLLSIWSITACSCPSRCSISTWATLLLNKLRWIWVLNHALIALVHANVSR